MSATVKVLQLPTVNRWDEKRPGLEVITCRIISAKIVTESITKINEYYCRTVIVAQLAERSLLTPEVGGSNPVVIRNLF